MAGQSEVGAKVSNSKSPPGGALWLVYKWEALRPLSEYFYASQSAGGGLFGTNEEAALRSRCRMVRYAVFVYCTPHLNWNESWSAVTP